MFLEQGRLGDCWFLSAVAVLTDVSRISEVIITPEYNEEGVYTVRFCIQVIIFGYTYTAWQFGLVTIYFLELLYSGVFFVGLLN